MPVRFFVSSPLSKKSEDRLKGAGVEFLALPLISFLPVEFSVQEVLNFSPDYAVFSSKRGVKFFFSRVSPELLKGVQVIAVGSSTAKELSALGFDPLVPEEFVGEGVVELLRNLPLKGARFLVVRPEKARSVVPDFLRESGASVKEVVAYRTVVNGEAEVPLKEFFSKPVDFVAFTSPSNFNAFKALLGKEEALKVLSRAKVVPIGPVSAEALKREGIEPYALPQKYTVDSLVDLVLSKLNA